MCTLNPSLVSRPNFRHHMRASLFRASFETWACDIFLCAEADVNATAVGHPNRIWYAVRAARRDLCHSERPAIQSECRGSYERLHLGDLGIQLPTP